MSVKAIYTDMVKKVIQQLRIAKDIEAIHKLKVDRKSYKAHSEGWLKVNLDSFLIKLKVTEDKIDIVNNKRKITIIDKGREYNVICAIGASYFRIQTKEFYDPNGKKHGGVYVGIDLKEPKTGHLKGKESKAERNRLTHFKMTYQKN